MEQRLNLSENKLLIIAFNNKFEKKPVIIATGECFAIQIIIISFVDK